jgi:ribonuclease P protein component
MTERSSDRIRHTFPKSEHLCHRRAFDYLFQHGSSIRIGVLTFFYVWHNEPEWGEAPVSVAFAAPKRAFKRAVDRNFLKRRMREAYRLHKEPLLEMVKPQEQQLLLLIKINGRQLTPYPRIRQATIAGITRLIERFGPQLAE